MRGRQERERAKKLHAHTNPRRERVSLVVRVCDVNQLDNGFSLASKRSLDNNFKLKANRMKASPNTLAQPFLLGNIYWRTSHSAASRFCFCTNVSSCSLSLCFFSLTTWKAPMEVFIFFLHKSSTRLLMFGPNALFGKLTNLNEFASFWFLTFLFCSFFFISLWLTLHMRTYNLIGV